MSGAESRLLQLEGSLGVVLPDDYRQFLNACDGLIEEIEQELKNPDLHSAGRGSKELAMVAGGGFEPPTFGL